MFISYDLYSNLIRHGGQQQMSHDLTMFDHSPRHHDGGEDILMTMN